MLLQVAHRNKVQCNQYLYPSTLCPNQTEILTNLFACQFLLGSPLLQVLLMVQIKKWSLGPDNGKNFTELDKSVLFTVLCKQGFHSTFQHWSLCKSNGWFVKNTSSAVLGVSMWVLHQQSCYIWSNVAAIYVQLYWEKMLLIIVYRLNYLVKFRELLVPDEGLLAWELPPAQ